MENRFIFYTKNIPTLKSDCHYLLGYLNVATSNDIRKINYIKSMNKECFALLSLGISFKKLKLSTINNNLLKNFNNNINNLYDIFINFNNILSYKNILFENGYNKDIYNNVNYSLSSNLANITPDEYLSIKDSYINYYKYNIFQLITKPEGLKLNLNSSLSNDFTIDVLFAISIDNLYNISDNKIVVIALGDRPDSKAYVNSINYNAISSENEYILVSIIDISETLVTMKIDYNTRYSYMFEYNYSSKLYNEIRIIISNKIIFFNDSTINILSSIRHSISNTKENKHNLYVKDFIINEYHSISNKIELGINYKINNNDNNSQSYILNYRYIKVYNQYIDSLDIINSDKNNNIINYKIDNNKLSTYYDFSYSSDNDSFYEYISDKRYIIKELDLNLQPSIIYKSIEEYSKEQFINNETKSLYIPNNNYELTLPLPKIDNNIGRLGKYIRLDSFTLEIWFIINKNFINNTDNNLETNIIYNYNINNKTFSSTVIKNLFKLCIIQDKLSLIMKTDNINDNINITHSLNTIVYNEWNYFSISIPNSLKYNKAITILYNSNIDNNDNNVSIYEYHEKSSTTINYNNFLLIISEANKLIISISNTNHKDLYIKMFRLWNNYNKLNFIFNNKLNYMDSDVYKYLLYNFEFTDYDIYSLRYKDYEISYNSNTNSNKSIKSSIDLFKINSYELKDSNRFFVRYPRIFNNKNLFNYNIKTCVKNYSKSINSKDYNNTLFNYINLANCKPIDKQYNSNFILGANLTNIKYNLSDKILLKNEIQFIFWYYNKNRIYDFDDPDLNNFKFISLDYKNISDNTDDILEIVSIRLSDYMNNILFVDNQFKVNNTIDSSSNIYTNLGFWKFAVVSVSTKNNMLLYNDKYFDIPYDNNSIYNEYLNNINKDFVSIDNNKKYYIVFNKTTKQTESLVINNNITSIYLKSLNIYNKIIDYSELLYNKYNYNINHKNFKLSSTSLIYYDLIFDLYIDKYGELNNIINEDNTIENLTNIDINMYNNIINDYIITTNLLENGLIKFDYLSNKETDNISNKIKNISICNSSFNENYKLDFKDNKCKIYYDKKDDFIEKVLQLNPNKEDYLIKLDINNDIKSKNNFDYPIYINKDYNTIDNYYISFWFKMKCLDCLDNILANMMLIEYNCQNIALDIYSHNQLILNNKYRLNYTYKQWIMVTIVANDNYNIIIKSNKDNNIYENLYIKKYKLNYSCPINFAKSKTINNSLNSFFLKDVIIGFYKVHFTFYEYLFNKNINFIDLGLYYYFKLKSVVTDKLYIYINDEVSKSNIIINEINTNYDKNNYKAIEISKDYKEKTPIVNICNDNSFSFNNSCNYINYYKLPFNSNMIIKNIYFNIPFAVEMSFKPLIKTKANLGIIKLDFGNIQIKASIEHKTTLSIYHALLDSNKNIVNKYDKYIDLSALNIYDNYVLVIGVEYNNLYIDYFTTYVKINDIIFKNIYRFRIEDYMLNSRDLEKNTQNVLDYISINLLYRNDFFLDDYNDTDNFVYLKYLRIYKYTPSNDILTKMANKYVIAQSYTHFYFYLDFRLFVSLDKNYFYDIVSGKTIKDVSNNTDYLLEYHNFILNSNSECSVYSSIDSNSNSIYNNQSNCYIKTDYYCKIGTFYDSYNETCLDCNSNCRSCFIEPNNCISCSVDYYLLEYKYNTCYNSKKYLNHYYVSNETVLLSNNNYYKDVFLLCNSNCFDCIGASKLDCSSCKGIKFIDSKGICSENCIEGELYDKTQGKCMPCSIECKTCEGAYNNCTECASNYVYLSDTNQCLDNCSVGYYEYEKNCLKCSDQCYDCTLYEDNCTECSNNYYPIQYKRNTCYRYNPPEYPYNYYLNGLNNEYELCDENCLTCYGNPKRCMSCKQYLLNNQCIDKCPDGMYGGLFKPPENVPYYVKNNKKCYNCNKVCELCYNNTEYCIKCARGYKKNVFNRCEIVCEPGYYIDYDDNVCIKCNSPCLTCAKNKNNCLTCINNYNFLKINSFNNNYNTCVETCPPKFTKVKNDIDECMRCKEECSKCTSLDFCTACEEGYYLILDLGLCVQTCPSNYFIEDKILCSICPKGCTHCLNRRHCTSCEIEYFFYPEYNSCKSNCIERHFINSNNYCEKCDINCLNCNQYKDNCTSCPEGKEIVVNENDYTKRKCVYNTVKDATVENKTLEAKTCPSNCLECENEKTCIKCDDETEYSVLVKGICISKCLKSDSYISSINKCINIKECILETIIIGPDVIDINDKDIDNSAPNEYYISLSYTTECEDYKNEIESNIAYSLKSDLISNQIESTKNNSENYYLIYASKLSKFNSFEIIIKGFITNKISLEELYSTELTVEVKSYDINIIIQQENRISVNINDFIEISAKDSYDSFYLYSKKRQNKGLKYKWECLIDGKNYCDQKPNNSHKFKKKVKDILKDIDNNNNDIKEFDIKLTVSNNKKEASKIIKINIDKSNDNEAEDESSSSSNSNNDNNNNKLIINSLSDGSTKQFSSNNKNDRVSSDNKLYLRSLFDLRLIEPTPKYLEIDLNDLNIGVNRLTITIENIKTKEKFYKQIKIVNYDNPKYGVCLVDDKLNSYALSVNETIYFKTMLWESIGIIKYSLVFRINKHSFNTTNEDKLRLDDIPISNYSFNTKFKIENLPINGKIYVKAFDPIANKSGITQCNINVSTSLDTINITKLQKILRNLKNITIYYDKLRAILTFFQLIKYNPLLYSNQYVEYCLNEFNRHIYTLNLDINDLIKNNETDISDEYNNYVNEYIYIQTVFNIIYEFEHYKSTLDEDNISKILETTNIIYNIKLDETLVNFLMSNKKEMLLSLLAKSFENMLNIFNNNYKSVTDNKTKFEKDFSKYLVFNYIKLMLLLNDDGVLELRLNKDFLVILKTTYSNKEISNIYDKRSYSLTNNKITTTKVNEKNKCYDYIKSIINLDNDYKYYIIDNNVGNKNVMNMYFNTLISSLKDSKEFNFDSKELDSIAFFGIEMHELHILSFKPEGKVVIKKFKDCFIAKEVSFNIELEDDTVDILLAKKNYIINLNLVCVSYNSFNNNINYCTTWINYEINKIECQCKTLGIIMVISNFKTLLNYSLEYQFKVDEISICKINLLYKFYNIIIRL